MTLRHNKPSLQERIFEAALQSVLDWYCHNNEPLPQWWLTTGPYNLILENMREENMR